MPITWEIVEKADAKTLGELTYYLSDPLMLVTDNDSKPVSRNGILVIEKDNNFEEVIIQSSSRGKIKNLNPKENESFEIHFEEKDITLKFDRDKEKNNFVYSEVVYSPREISLKHDGVPPFLCIEYYNNGNINPAVQPLPPVPVPVPPTPVPTPAPPVIPSPSPPIDPRPNVSSLPLPSSRNIMGRAILSNESIVEYIQLKNKTISRELIEMVVGFYIDEARKENINHDIAIAQMCEGTNYLNKREVFNNHNYGDLQYLSNRGAINLFPNMQLGIRAHIQQLKTYADPRGPAAERKVDSIRISGVGKNSGNITTLDQLFPVWVTKNLNNYRNEINTILAEMQIFADRKRY
jgi:hypothetical protein